MKIYGVGLFLAPNSSRVIWDFSDGPFDTVNPVLLAEAKKRGYSFTPQIVDVNEKRFEDIKAEEPSIPGAVEAPRKKPGRPAKVVKDEHSEHI